MKNKIILCATFLVILCSPFSITYSNTGSERVLRYANDLFKDKEYYRAITEYRRFISYYPEDARVKEVYFRISDCYFAAQRFADEVHWNERIQQFFKTQDVFDTTNLRMGRSYFALQRYLEASEHFTAILSNNSAEIKLKNQARFMKGHCLLREENWGAASKEFSLVEEGGPYFSVSQVYSERALMGSKLKLKSPLVSGVLSIIPGLGYLYTGNTQTALASFIVNGLCMWGTVNAFDKRERGLGILLGLFSLGWYTGNIYGSILSAYKINHLEKEKFFQQFEYQNLTK